MNLVFLCGSLEPGKDGVGDYSRRLAGALVQLGHVAALVALSESEVPPKQTTEQFEDGIRLPVLRLHKGQSWAHKKPVLEAFINTHKPDVLSLQYVPYAFHPKGLAFGVGKQLSELKTGARWHFMFHELWVGIESEPPFKSRIYGLLQKAIIKNTLRALQPNLITTQTRLYQHLLQQMGNTVHLLPLFGNIPVATKQHSPKSEERLIFILFGGIHHSAKIEGFASWIKGLENRQAKPEVHFVGTNGEELTPFKSVLERMGIFYKVHGRQDAAEVSRLLSVSHIGITTTPYLLCEKSGSVAAMLDHGLPVLCIARDWQVPERSMPQATTQPVCLWHENVVLTSVLDAAVPGNPPGVVAERFINLIRT